MNLNIKDELFLVGGATSGLGKAIAEVLAKEGASVIAVARGKENLDELSKKFPGLVETVCSDITGEDIIAKLLYRIGNRQLHGILVNAGGPPAMTVLETSLEDWDNAYRTVLRWKVALTQSLIPRMIEKHYGRVVYVESATVKQPMENLVLSNSMRLAVVGYVKTLSQEISRHGVTLNVLAPGYHETPAMERLFAKKMEQTGIDKETVKNQYICKTSVGFLGAAEDFASIAAWLLSPHSRYITGQTISVDGGVIKGVMG